MACLKIDLRVLNVDLDDEPTFELIGSQLSDLVWSSIDERVLASLIIDTEVYVSSVERVDAVTTTARRIMAALPHAVIECVDEDLVTVSDIAVRSDLNRETVRSYVAGIRGPGEFPLPESTVGGGSRGGMKVWRWGPVNDWLRRLHLDDDYVYLSRAEAAEMNVALAAHRRKFVSASPLLGKPSGDTKVIPMDAYKRRRLSSADLELVARH